MVALPQKKGADLEDRVSQFSSELKMLGFDPNNITSVSSQNAIHQLPASLESGIVFTGDSIVINGDPHVGNIYVGIDNGLDGPYLVGYDLDGLKSGNNETLFYEKLKSATPTSCRLVQGKQAEVELKRRYLQLEPEKGNDKLEKLRELTEERDFGTYVALQIDVEGDGFNSIYLLFGKPRDLGVYVQRQKPQEPLQPATSLPFKYEPGTCIREL